MEVSLTPSWRPADDGSACARPAHASRTVFTGWTRSMQGSIMVDFSKKNASACRTDAR